MASMANIIGLHARQTYSEIKSFIRGRYNRERINKALSPNVTFVNFEGGGGVSKNMFVLYVAVKNSKLKII
jgi:hypothetical protein